MRRWARGFWFVVAITLLAAGCKGGASSSTTTIAISPTAVTLLVNATFQFGAAVSDTSTAVTWSVNGVTGGNSTVGTITTGGLYTAPATVPANTTITVTASQGNNSASATVTLDSGVRVTLAPTTATIGTGETQQFIATVTGVPVSGDSSVNFTFTPTGNGASISPTGLFTAGTAAGTVTITATSNFDTKRAASSVVTVVTAVDPTVTSIGSPNGPTVGAVGALFQDLYLTGTGFLSTSTVFINGVPVSPLNVSVGSPTSLLVRVPADRLTAPGTFTVTVSRQGGAPQSCAVAPQCQLVLSRVRPAVVGTSPDSIPIPAANQDFTVNGGFFGTSANPTVTAQFANVPKTPAVINARQLTVTINPGDAPVGGLYPVTVLNQGDAQRAVVNLAVEPPLSGSTLATLPVGAAPASVAVNTATGVAVVANQGSHNVTLINVDTQTVLGYICSGDAGAVLTATSTTCAANTAAPVSVAVDNVRNLALVANSGTKTVGVINLAGTPTVSTVIPSGPTSISGTPAAIGVNPQTGKAVVTYQTLGYASLIDVTGTPAVTGIVTISTGPNPHVTVSPKLNWAVVTPGGLGSLSIVDLSRSSAVSISTAVRASNSVTVTTSAAHGLAVGDVVMIKGTSLASFAGIFNVATVPSSTTFTFSQSGAAENATGGTVTHSSPVATLAVNASVVGAAFNEETSKVVLADNAVGASQILNALDQSSTAVPLPQAAGNVAAAVNPLTNVAVVVNRTASVAQVIDPTGANPVAGTFAVGNTPVDVAIDPGSNKALIVNQAANTVTIASLGAIRSPQILQLTNQTSPTGTALADVIVNSNLTTAGAYSDQTFTVVGQGFSGASVARLDADPTGVQVLSSTSRTLTIKVSASRLQAGGPRRYALDVVNGGTAVSNAAGFTVVQSVDLTSTGCAAPSPLGVAVDSQRNLAIVSEPGTTATPCSSISIVKLAPGAAQGTGQTLAVGTNPVGIDVLPQAELAVVANSGSSNASVVDLIAGSVLGSAVATDLSPAGVAIDPGLAKAVVTAAGANVADTFTVAATPGTGTAVPVQQRPVGVGVDPFRHLALVGNTTGNTALCGVSSSGTATLIDVAQNAATISFCLSSPAGITFDPVLADFLVAQNLLNQVAIVDPSTQTTSAIRVGINPTSIADNFATGTMVTTNNLSNSMTVVDLIARQVRAVLPVTASNAFSIEIQRFTNLAVIADTANNRLLLVPLPR